MKTESNETHARVVYTKKVPAPGMFYAWTWDVIETEEELLAQKKQLTIAEQIKFRNDQAENKARSAAFVAAAEAAKIEKPTAENSGLIRLKDALKNMLACKLKDGVSPKYTEAEARAMAETVTGESWSDYETE